ncbi:SIR2 family NAD-dependent protein deacylase (plasmid) [Agrobacterium sp. rho-13.3]|uniref:SIR2 family NAD-dependent protein deacylase n=1 Tax=Agrobacterium sp. rho-13.3 TaxID=3072980 RepID=UPI002A147DED|nr:SIR2 family protein [Agrobacterium sp. rho-13.3]MDX8312030.1 SIR2 family protein [Agrobacterium sp. rho-13.3]
MHIPRGLKEAIQNRRIVPFVGAGFARAIKKKDRSAPLFPSWKELLLDAAIHLRDDGRATQADSANIIEAMVRRNDLVQAARIAAQDMGRRDWIEFLKHKFDVSYDEADAATLNLLRKVWGLGSNLIVTTNYDRSLQWACPNLQDLAHWDIVAKAEQITTQRDGNTKRPTVWHLHGRIDNANNIIVTPDGYADLYGTSNDTAGNRAFIAALDTLHTLIRTQSLLFLGFSLQDKDFIKQLLAVRQIYDGAGVRHFALLPEKENRDKTLDEMGITAVTYSDHSEIPEILEQLSLFVPEASPVFVRANDYVVDREEGLHVFGGRGDGFFKLYDEAITGLNTRLDIFSLKLRRFRREHTETILGAAKRSKIRIALIDPKFPLPEDHVSLASLREREERSAIGSVREDVAAWKSVHDAYRSRVEAGEIVESETTGLEIRLYNILPTVNLFCADDSLFVGPYLLDVEDRNTPTFLLRGPRKGSDSISNDMFMAYNQHFEAVWNDKGTRPIAIVAPEEIAAWRAGKYYSAAI